jgi:hypothetical protein
MPDTQSPYVDAENQEIVDSSAEAESIRGQVLAARADESLREAAVADDGTASEWRAVTSHFEDYIMTQHAAADTWTEEKDVRPSSHRFTVGKALEYEGKVRGGLRHVRDNAPDALPLKTILVTRTGWPYDDAGRPAPPVEYLRALQDGREAFLDTLRGVLDDVPRWGRVTVREPHEEGGRRPGYPHAHDGIVVVGDVTETDIRPAVDAYVRSNPFARQQDHDATTDAITVWDTDTRMAPFERLGDELTNGLIGYAFDANNGSPLDGATDAERRFAALMWACGRQSVTFGETFGKWIDRSQDDWTPPDDGEGDTSGARLGKVEDGGGVERLEPEDQAVAFDFDEVGDETDSERLPY